MKQEVLKSFNNEIQKVALLGSLLNLGITSTAITGAMKEAKGAANNLGKTYAPYKLGGARQLEGGQYSTSLLGKSSL